jgi:hypothetical protein
MRRIPVKATMDPTHGDHLSRSMSSVRWTLAGHGHNRQVFVEPSPSDDDGYTWLDVSVVTFITLLIDAGA